MNVDEAWQLCKDQHLANHAERHAVNLRGLAAVLQAIRQEAEKGATTDLETYGLRVVPGGYIALHDFANDRPDNDCRVRQAWGAWEGRAKFRLKWAVHSLAIFQRRDE